MWLGVGVPFFAREDPLVGFKGEPPNRFAFAKVFYFPLLV